MVKWAVTKFPDGNVMIRLAPRSMQDDPVSKTEPIDFKNVRKWYNACKGCHQMRCGFQSPTLPSTLRLIDCLTLQIVTLESLPTRDSRYLALSYVWGKSNAQIQAFTAGEKLPDGLPQTIVDSIHVTVNLGFRYLWVDRYCIPQDDDSKHAQIKQMRSIYERAEITLIAASGKNAMYGLSGIQEWDNLNPDFSQIPESLQTPGLPAVDFVGPISLAQISLTSSNWSTRGWTFQEGFLSRRRLVFLEYAVYWQCNSIGRYVAFGNGTSMLDRSAARFDNDILGMFAWRQNRTTPQDLYDSIMYYANRRFSYESDTLEAFSGILDYHRKRKSPTYSIWGVPFAPGFADRGRLGLLYGLCWHFKAVGRRRIGFPSWSWAGWSCDTASTTFAVMFDVHSSRSGVCQDMGIFLPDIWFYMKDGSQVSWDTLQSLHTKMNLDEQRTMLRTIGMRCWTISLKLVNIDDQSVPGMIEQIRVTMSYSVSGKQIKIPFYTIQQKVSIQTEILGIFTASHQWENILIIRKLTDCQWERIGIMDMFSDITGPDLDEDRSYRRDKELTERGQSHQFSSYQHKWGSASTVGERLLRLNTMIDEGEMVQKLIDIT
jgi:hypothetical protein